MQVHAFVFESEREREEKNHLSKTLLRKNSLYENMLFFKGDHMVYNIFKIFLY